MSEAKKVEEPKPEAKKAEAPKPEANKLRPVDRGGSWRKALAKLRQQQRGSRIPFIQQMASTDCGAACLAMVLTYHGKPVGLGDVRDMSGVGRDGVNAKQLMAAARWYGLRARGVSIELAHLPHLPTATVLHWGFNHFVVLERVHKDAIEIIDPGIGRRKVPLEEVRAQFTGVALMFEPGPSFETSEAERSRVWRYLRQIFARTGHWHKLLITSLLLQLFALAIPILTGALVDRVVPRNDDHLLLVMGVGLSALVVFFFLVSMIRAHLLLQLRTLFDARMTLDFLDHLVELPYAFLQRRSSGDLMARVNSNATIREIFTSGALSGFLDGTLVVLYLVLLLWASPGIGLLVVGLAAVQALVIVLAKNKQRELMAKSLHLQARADGNLVELLAGIETVKLSGTQHRSVAHWTDLFVEVLNVSTERGKLDALISSLIITLRLASPLAVLCYGASLVLDGHLTLGTMLGLNALAIGFFTPLSNLLGTASQLQLLSTYVKRIEDVLDTPPEQDPQAVSHAPPLSGRVQLDHVSFQYTPLAPLVLKDVSLTIEPGQMVAIVGRSGSGKSTLASLLMALYQPTSGRILYDELDTAQLDVTSLRQQLGMVPQYPYIFGKTIRANVALVDPTMDLDRVIEATRAACIHDDILAMPLGYETPLIDGGGSLSGGQRQRLALARALINKPPIIVLDEATSALDAVTEAKVQRSLAEQRCTRIIIAHRLSTVRYADVILVMEAGTLTERGTHEELIAKGGVYAELVLGQVASEGPGSSASKAET